MIYVQGNWLDNKSHITHIQLINGLIKGQKRDGKWHCLNFFLNSLIKGAKGAKSQLTKT